MPGSGHQRDFQKLPIVVKLYIYVLGGCGLALAAMLFAHWSFKPPWLFAVYLLLGTLSSGMKVRLPGVTGTLSVGFLFILLGIADCSASEAVAIAWATTLTQLYWKPNRRPRLIQVIFNLGSTTIATTAAYGLLRFLEQLPGMIAPLPLVLASSGYFVANTLSVAGVIALTEGQSIHATWRKHFLWAFPHYLVGASFAGLVSIANRTEGWHSSLLVLPVVYLIFRSLGVYVQRLETEKRHAEEIAALHMRTIEALAYAIDTKDDTTHDHLRRVQTYAVEIGKRLGLDAQQLEALRVASLLHDVGKLAVPDAILKKPSRLTPEEFDKIKTHTIVGAEIAERIEFPYPVAPIIRAHHEKWNGTGYPDGLKGEQIPLGARILAAVDCLDALTTHRHYRPAMSLEEAIAYLRSEAGKSFDPKVVEALERYCHEIESLLKELPPPTWQIHQSQLPPPRGAPAAGFETATAELHRPTDTPDSFFSSFSEAWQELDSLVQLSRDSGGVEPRNVLALACQRISEWIPHELGVVFLNQARVLVPFHVHGKAKSSLSDLRIPVGQGLSGWVAENGQPIFNANPALDLGEADQLQPELQWALSVPLKISWQAVGVIALYRGQTHGAFRGSELKLLVGLAPKMAFLLARCAETNPTLPVLQDRVDSSPLDPNVFRQLSEQTRRTREQRGHLVMVLCETRTPVEPRACDSALRAEESMELLAQALRTCCRSTDTIYRVGKRRFVILLHGAGEQAAVEFPHRVELALTHLQERTKTRAFSLDVGTAVLPSDGEDAIELLAAAEGRLLFTRLRHGDLSDGFSVMDETVPTEAEW